MMEKFQDYYEVIEKQDFYEIIQNKYGEIAIFIDARSGTPKDPELLYDGKASALLKRDASLAVRLDDIHDEAKEPLASAEVVMIAELRGKTIERIYGVPVNNVEEIAVAGKESRADEIIMAKSQDSYNFV